MQTEVATELDAGNIDSNRRFLAIKPAIYAIVLIVGITGTFVLHLRTDGIFGCQASGYSIDSYLAYCNTTNYGDYDHSAFWFGLEPDARQSVAAADVLFIGNSRLQFAFSTPITNDWFSALAARYYLLGFSYSENAVFFAPLLSRLTPRAKVYVINVDRFFDDRVTPPTQEIFDGANAANQSSRKRFWQLLHEPICATFSSLCGNAVAFFRNRYDGSWVLSSAGALQGSGVADGPITDRDKWAHFADLGARFIADLPIERQCALLTTVPYDATKRAEAQEMANALNLELISPEIDGLRTFDGSHLDRRSAELWAAAFFAAAGPRIRQCMAESPAEAQAGEPAGSVF